MPTVLVRSSLFQLHLWLLHRGGSLCIALGWCQSWGRQLGVQHVAVHDRCNQSNQTHSARLHCSSPTASSVCIIQHLSDFLHVVACPYTQYAPGNIQIENIQQQLLKRFCCHARLSKCRQTEKRRGPAHMGCDHYTHTTANGLDTDAFI